MRILPRLNEAVNEEWISDKARFQYDALRRQRLNIPMVRGPSGALQNSTWGEAVGTIKGTMAKVGAQAHSADCNRSLSAASSRNECFGTYMWSSPALVVSACSPLLVSLSTASTIEVLC